ncbi:CCA tRNA nucleotidyltransferase [bacterium]|nr:CCA tRNA nucleotidyltransferase [bacterium]
MISKKSNKNQTLPSQPEEVLESIARHAEQYGTEVYIVGGYVRDQLLGRDFRDDLDLAVVGNAPEFAESLASELGIRKKITVYRRFGTAQLQVGKISLEFASTRKESYNEASRNPDVQPATLEEDLSRRDFTVNAMAVNIQDRENIIDLFGGKIDLENRIIRTPLEPSRTFSDDPLRILRAVRFAAKLNFEIHQDTLEAMKQERERLKIVSRERINTEFFKILGHNPPSHGLRLLFDAGILEIIFPEISNLSGVEQIGKHHHKDVFNHTLIVVDKVAQKTDRVDLRFAALMHDIGKPTTKRFVDEIGWTFHGHEHVGERMVRKFKKQYKFPEELTDHTSKLVRLHMRPLALQDEGVTDSAIRRLLVQAGEEIDDLLLICRADITSGKKERVKRYLASFDRMVERMAEIETKDQLKRFQSPIRGEEIMERAGLSEGPRVGLIKALIEEEILAGNIEFTYEAANDIFAEVVKKVEVLEDSTVLRTLQNLMRSRSDGLPPAPEPQEK